VVAVQSFHFMRPLFLILIPVVLYPLYLMSKGSLLYPSEERKRGVLVVGVIIGVLLVSALSGLAVEETRHGRELMIIVDGSESMRIGNETEDIHSAAIRMANTVRSGTEDSDHIAFISMGSGAQYESNLGTTDEVGRYTGSNAMIGHATDIESGIRLALSGDPRDRRILLLSDGIENKGDLSNGVDLSRGKGVPIDVVVFDRGDVPELMVSSVQLPERVESMETFDIVAVIDNLAGTMNRAEVIFLEDGSIMTNATLDLLPGENVIHYERYLDTPGLHSYDILLRSPLYDSKPFNNDATGFVHVDGNTSVLIMTGAPGEEANLVSVLRHSGMDVEVRPGRDFPGTLRELGLYDVVIMSDVSSFNLTTFQMNLAKQYVRDMGGGFIMVGGKQSFGAGGYMGTPIEDTLPVNMTPRDISARGTISVSLVIDRSGSMGGSGPGGGKLEVAKGAAIDLLGYLNPDDEISVISFDTVAKVELGLTGVSSFSSVHEEQIMSIQDGGGTSVMAGLVASRDLLTGSNRQLKHVIILTDGMTGGGGPNDYRLFCEGMLAQGITVSTIGIGTDADTTMLQLIADAGGGHHYPLSQAEEIPLVFSKDTLLQSRSYVVEQDFIPILERDHPILDGVGIDSAPGLHGYVTTSIKVGSLPILQALDGDPLLALRQYGVGRSVAYTSDITSYWATDWLGWGGFGQFWTQVVRWSAGEPNDIHYIIDNQWLDGDTYQLDIEANDIEGDRVNGLDMSAHLVGISTDVPVNLAQSGPGRYTGSYQVPVEGSYILTVIRRSGDSTVTWVSGLHMSNQPELSELRPRPDVLEVIAERTGGRVLMPGQDYWTDIVDQWKGRIEWRELHLDILTPVLLMLPLMVAGRKVTTTRSDVTAMLSSMGNRRSSPKEKRQGTVSSRFLMVKQRTRSGLSYTIQPDELQAIRSNKAPVEEGIPVPTARKKGSDLGGKDQQRQPQRGTLDRLSSAKTSSAKLPPISRIPEDIKPISPPISSETRSGVPVSGQRATASRLLSVKKGKR